MDPAYETCRRNLALVELGEGHTDEALRLYEVGMQQDYVNMDVYFAPAPAARGDRVGALAALLQQYRAHPALPQALFRVLTGSAFGTADRQDAIALAAGLRDDQEAALGALWTLKGYDRMVGFTTDTRVFWLRSEPDWLKSAARKRMIEQWRIPEYWRAHGFPPQCQPVGSADFTCP